MHRANQAHKEWLLLVRANMTALAKVAGQSKLVATAAAIFIASKNSRCNPVPSTFPFGAIQWLPAWLPAVDTSAATLIPYKKSRQRVILCRVDDDLVGVHRMVPQIGREVRKTALFRVGTPPKRGNSLAPPCVRYLIYSQSFNKDEKVYIMDIMRHR